jgi:hypothetical protein
MTAAWQSGRAWMPATSVCDADDAAQRNKIGFYCLIGRSVCKCAVNRVRIDACVYFKYSIQITLSLWKRFICAPGRRLNANELLAVTCPSCE